MLPLTPERLAGVYVMLKGFPPFCRWKLPPVEDIRLHVAKTNRWHAAWWIEGSTHHVEVSVKTHHHISSLVTSMAHELIHMKQRIAKTETRGVEHNAEFRQLAKLVCKRMGFDLGQF